MSGDGASRLPSYQSLSPGVRPAGASSIYTHYNDPRASSTQSLVPSDAEQNDGRRRLLLIYIHGFMGDETSFRSFPAHVHNILAITLQESHMIHTKIYPHYRSRRPIKDAVEDFSRWLEPHENPMTDVLLLSHSMGGILAADVALLPPRHATPGVVLRHRLIGLVNFDVPFLGLHPGIIPAGISSIFKPWPEPTENPNQGNDSGEGSSTLGTPGRQDTLFSPPKDPRFNPRFSNDVVLPVRKGWDGPLHFLKKHSDDLFKASRNYVKSHLQFGGAMADYPTLKSRYNRIRALEEERGEARQRLLNNYGATPPRVRFINFYTASHGRPKKEKPSSHERSTSAPFIQEGANSLASGAPATSTTSLSVSPHRSPRISIEDPGGQSVQSIEPMTTEGDLPKTEEAEKADIQNSPYPLSGSGAQQSSTTVTSVPDPSSSSLDLINMNTAVSAPTAGASGPYSWELSENYSSPAIQTSETPKKVKDKKFCMLPSKGSDGTRDRTWIRVFMRDMDEVGAHTQLFFLGETYEQLVGDTAARIEAWVGEDMTRRLLEDLGADAG